jgi:predicted solute-binding protein
MTTNISSTVINTSQKKYGTVVEDCDKVINYVLQKGEILTKGKNSVFPSTSLEEINSILSHSTQIDLKRPRQHSYPYIDVLYMLLRATGILSTEKKKVLLKNWDRNLTDLEEVSKRS